MKHFTIILLALTVICTVNAQAPVKKDFPGLKGNGQVFFLETFGWENPADPKGWTAPAGYYMVDPTDNGYNWHWWPMDSLNAQWVSEPPFMSTTAENGSLTLFADKYNEYKEPTIPLDNSIGFPPIDCSSHGSVLVRYETTFMNYSTGWKMLLEVSVDDWLHSAQYDVGFGCGHKGRPNNTTPGKPAIYEANISDVAAGQANVQIRFTWRETDDYFWQIDDFTLAEAWDNDLQMKFAQMEWNDGDPETVVTPIFMVPKTQIATGSLFHFKSSVLNFGEYDQSDVFLEVDVTKNNQSIWTRSSPKKSLYTIVTDTVTLSDEFTPAEYGHYKVSFLFNQKEAEDTPENNSAVMFFDVTDSVYSRADHTAEEAYCWGFEAYSDKPNLAHAMAAVYPIYKDCEATSISAFIAGGKADGMIDFRFKLLFVPAEEGDPENPVELLQTESFVLDSSMLGTWITLPLDRDGESEFLPAGSTVYAAVEYNNMHEDLYSRRYENLKIGADHSFRILDYVSVAKGDDGYATSGYGASRNLMIRLNLNEHGNMIDGTGPETAVPLLQQNFPNPFSRSTEIRYDLIAGAEVVLEIRDLAGRVVQVNREGYRPAGAHSLKIKSENLESGIYFYTLHADTFRETRQMVVSN